MLGTGSSTMGLWGAMVGVLALVMELTEPIRPGFGLGFGLARRLRVLRKLLRRLASPVSVPDVGNPGRGGSAVLGWFERNLACRSVIS